ncbi:MAG TPA: beta-ketoacyl-ACP synthase II [Mycobacteriales bacterium]
MNGDGTAVVITGIGAVTPVGNDRESTWSALCAGQSGIGPITSFDASGLPVRIAAEVKGFDPTGLLDLRRLRRSTRMTHLGVAAAREAALDAGLVIGADGVDAARVGAVINTAVAGMSTIEDTVQQIETRGPERVSPYFVPSVIPNMPACEVAIDLGVHGPVVAASLACASGLHAVLAAGNMIRMGDADVVLAGGTDAAIGHAMFSGLARMGALSRRNDDPTAASRPFDADRDGFVFGEGAVVLVLESAEHAAARGATAYAEVLGGALTSDAFHVSAPAPDGEYATAAVRQAVARSGRGPADLDYVCAHGTSTRINDRVETHVLHEALGKAALDVAVSSPKSMVGHLIGAAGALSAMTCVMAMRDSVIPPTINLATPDPDCDLDYVPGTARKAEVGTAMANAFGFGGQNCVVLFGRSPL